MTLKYIWRSFQPRLLFPRPFQLSLACFRVARSPSNSWACYYWNLFSFIMNENFKSLELKVPLRSYRTNKTNSFISWFRIPRYFHISIRFISTRETGLAAEAYARPVATACCLLLRATAASGHLRGSVLPLRRRRDSATHFSTCAEERASERLSSARSVEPVALRPFTVISSVRGHSRVVAVGDGRNTVVYDIWWHHSGASIPPRRRSGLSTASSSGWSYIALATLSTSVSRHKLLPSSATYLGEGVCACHGSSIY